MNIQQRVRKHKLQRGHKTAMPTMHAAHLVIKSELRSFCNVAFGKDAHTRSPKHIPFLK